MTTVVNIRKHKSDIYIGRGSIWGNPFKITKQVDREQAIRMYEEYIVEKIATEPNKYSLSSLKDKVLGCFCKPLDCHGDFLAALANQAYYPKDTCYYCGGKIYETPLLPGLMVCDTCCLQYSTNNAYYVGK